MQEAAKITVDLNRNRETKDALPLVLAFRVQLNA
jgi:hypothetical protein